VGVLHDLLRRPQQSCRYVSRQRFLAHNKETVSRQTGKIEGNCKPWLYVSSVFLEARLNEARNSP
jgi:hypothetical protein